jgi:hypothetical protein
MERKLCVLFYSKYSPASKRLLDGMNSCGIDLERALGLTMVSVDNSEIRQQIQESNNIEIDRVPCLLNVFTDGGVEKFDDEQLLEWMNLQIQALQPRRHPPTSVPIQIEEPVPAPVPAKRKKDVPAPIMRKKKDIPAPPPEPESESESDEATATNIDDLSSEEEEDSNPTARPPTVLRNDAGNYELADIGEPIAPNRQKPEDATTKKRALLMSAAADMQKSREREDEKSRPAGMPQEKR